MNGTITERIIKKGIDLNGKRKENLKVYDAYFKYWDLKSSKRRTVSKKGFRRKGDAERYLAEAIAKVQTNQFVPNIKISTKEFLENWFNTEVKKNLKECTVDGYWNNLKLHIIPEIGHIPLQQLTSHHVQEFYSSLYKKYQDRIAGGLSPKTITYIHRVLSRALDNAVKQGLISVNVSKNTVRPKIPKYQNQVLSVEELRNLLKHVKNTWWEVPIILGGMCGLRRGEVLGLKWQDISFTEKTIKIHRTLISYSGGQKLVDSTKTETSNRLLAVSDEIIEVLKMQNERYQLNKATNIDTFYDNDLVVCNDDGSPVIANSFSKRFTRILLDNDIKLIRFHDLRHTFSTILMSSDVPLKVVSQLLGHSSVSITADIYQHVLDPMKRQAAAKMSEAVFKSVKEQLLNYVA